MADLVSGQISFTGLGSGTDFNAMIEQLLEVEGINRTRMELWKQDWQDKVDAFQELNTKLLSLKTTLGGMDTMEEFLVKTASSSDTTVLTATADSTATEGTYSIEVNQLAQNAVLTHNSGASAITNVVAASAETFAYDYKGTTYSVALAAGTTLEGMKNLINNDPNNPGVRANLISDGTNHYLQIRGLDQGDTASLAINAATTLGGYAAADFTTTQTNQDSQIRVNGWPTATWIESDSNTITSAIEGLTLALKKADPGNPIQLTVSTDIDTIKENVRTFVDQTNEVRQIIKDLTSWDSVKQEGSILTGNYGVQLISTQLKSATAEKGVGFDYYDSTTSPATGDRFSSLSQLGILTDADDGSATTGLLQLNEATLAAALASDAQAVAELFAADHLGTADVSTGNFNYHSHIDDITQAGEYSLSYDIDAAGNISNAFIGGVAASIDNTNNTITSSSGDSKGLVVLINDLTPNSSGSGDIRIKLGKAGEMEELLKSLTSTTSGPLHILEENYEDIMDNIDKKIERETSRLDRMERDLKNKFARLEALLGYYDQLSTSLGSQIAGMDSG